MSAWTKTIDAIGVAETLKRCGRVVLVTHAKPDGDAIGSTSALALAIDRAASRPVAQVLYAGAMPLFRDDFLSGVPHQHVADASEASVFVGESTDAVIVCDTGSWGQLDVLADAVRGFQGTRIVIDHHLRGDADVADAKLLETDAAAVCEPVADVCAALLGVIPRELPSVIASLLYLGLATDTGWFRFSSVTPRTLRLAADLVEAGADTTRVLSSVTQRDRPARLRAMAAALTSAEFVCGGEFVVMRLSSEDIARAGASPEDLSGLQDAAMSIATVRAVALFTEVGSASEPLVKASLRSKPGDGMVNVSNVAGALGGGGHANAAGVKQRTGLDEAIANVISAYETELSGSRGTATA